MAVSKKQKRSVSDGTVHISATYNNTLITITDRAGNTLTWASAGSCDFKGSRKSTPYAAQFAAEKAAIIAKDNGMRNIMIIVKGPGPGRDAYRAFENLGFTISAIYDLTPIAHNGCRKRKKRRV